MTVSYEPFNQLAASSVLGIVRGVTVHTMIYPLSVIKAHQQDKFNQEKSYQVAKRLFQDGGLRAFYRGLFPQLLKTGQKQVWCWPMITGIPFLFESYDINPLLVQATTGLAIATTDAAIATPLERAKIQSILKNRKFSLRDVYKEGWHGFSTFWMKLSVEWSTFLVAQKYFRSRYAEKSGKQKLTLPQLMDVGVRTALVVSVVSGPFDRANTIKQSNNLSISHLFSGNFFRNFYRGSPVNAVGLVVHNIASVILIDQLDKSKFLD